MHDLLVAGFWLGPELTLYVYVVFPIVMLLAARPRRRAVHAPDLAAPAVSVIVPAYNEERHIGARIRNLLDSDYPPELLDVIVVSDASTDGTNAIARDLSGDRVHLLVQPERRGKTAGLNQAVPMARGEIVVFTDANASYPADTLRKLTDHFRDPRVGLVTGFTKYVIAEDGGVAESVNAYTTIERTVKRGESRWGYCVGADGAIFAMRRSLYRPLRADDINDLVLPLCVVEQGYHCIFVDDAFCSENAGADFESEFQRQSRITNRSLRAIRRHAGLLDPFRYPGFSWLFWSHKVLRFLVPVFLVLSGVALFVLALQDDVFGRLAVVLIAAAALVVLIERSPVRRPRWTQPARFAHLFFTVNLAMLHGWWKFLTGRADVTWQPERADAMAVHGGRQNS